MAPTPESIAGRYRVARLLGEGQMGSVYLAHDARLDDRPCAVKVLHPAHLDDQYRRRFERESRIMARLRSPHIVGLLDVGETAEGQPYLVLEYLEGRPLSEALSPEAPMRSEEALRLTGEILRGLGAAHAEGIIHRDLSLNNIFLARDPDGLERAKILDFGLAKDSTGLSGEAITQRGSALGTPTHMSPELLRGEAIDHRADLYAAGIVLYRMLTGGRAPFRANADLPSSVSHLSPTMRVGWQHLRSPPPPIERLPEPIWAYIERLLAKDREARFQTAEAALTALPDGAAPHVFAAQASAASCAWGLEHTLIAALILSALFIGALALW